MKTKNYTSRNSLIRQAMQFGAVALTFGLLAACGGGDTLGTETVNEANQADAMSETPAETYLQTEARLETRTTDGLGTYLTDAEGRSLYLYKADSPGNSTCYNACAKAWPPYLTQGKPIAGQGVSESMVGTIERRGGGMQVTYNGWPLYYYANDSGPGQTTGQDVMGFGAEWYLVTPQGKEVHSEGHEH